MVIAMGAVGILANEGWGEFGSGAKNILSCEKRPGSSYGRRVDLLGRGEDLCGAGIQEVSGVYIYIYKALGRTHVEAADDPLDLVFRLSCLGFVAGGRLLSLVRLGLAYLL